MDQPFDTLSALLDARYSTRAFRPDPLPDQVIARIVTAAGRAPSWCNAQPWQVTVTRGADTARFRKVIEEAALSQGPSPDLPWPTGYSGAHKTRRQTCGFQLYDAVGIDRADKSARHAQMMRNYAFFDAPHVAIVTSGEELGPYGAMDCGGFVTAFMLAATALGVGSIAQASVAAYPDVIRTHFGLPDTRLVLCAISFGYADDTHPANRFRTERAGLDDILDIRGDS